MVLFSGSKNLHGFIKIFGALIEDILSKSRRQERCRSKEAKAIATSNIVVNLPEFSWKDPREFAESLG